MDNFVLKSSPKIFQHYKSDIPAKTIANAKKFLKSIGIDLSKLKYDSHKISNGKFSVYASALVYENAFVASGKGLTYQLSEASAYSEAVERVAVGLSKIIPFANSPEYFQKRPDLLGSTVGKQSEIKNAVDIKGFFKYFPAVSIKELKKRELSKHWVDAFSLRENKYKKVPHQLIEHISASNGCAAGNTLEEAISQAFCEVYERYSLLEHVSKRLPAPTIDPGSIKDETVHQGIELFNSMNIDVEIKDLTLGNKIPVVGVLFTNQNLAHEKDTMRNKLFFKTISIGSHLDLNHAIVRCFTERIQTENADRDKMMYHREIKILDDYFSPAEKEKIIKRINHKKHLLPLLSLSKSFDDFSFLGKSRKTIPLSSLQSRKTENFLEDIEIIKDISRKNNWSDLIINYSTPALPLKVVRVAIPAVSDTLRCRHPHPARTTDIFKILTVSVENKKRVARQIIDLLEENLVDKVAQLIPDVIREKYLAEESLPILLGLYLFSKNKKKGAKIAELLEQYLPPLTTLLKNNRWEG